MEANQDRVIVLERENNDLKRRSQDQSQYNDLVSELRNKDRVIGDLNNEIVRMSRDLEQTRELNRSTMAAPQQQTNTKELENKINYLMSENSKLKYDLESYQKVEDSSYKTKYLIDDLNRKLGSLEVEKSRVEQAMANKTIELGNLEAVRRQDREDLEAMRVANKRLQDKVQDLETERAQYMRNNIREDTQTNQNQIENLRNENKSLMDRLNISKDDHIRARDEIINKENLLNKANMEIQKKEFELKSAVYEKDRLNNEVIQLNQLKEKIKDASVWEDKMNNLRNEINNLREKTIHLEKANLDKETEIANLRKGTDGMGYKSEKGMQSGQ